MPRHNLMKLLSEHVWINMGDEAIRMMVYACIRQYGLSKPP